jgi:hypothetical protein
VPPWFIGAMEHILTETMAPIRADFQDMKDNIQDMKVDIQDMKVDIQNMKDDIGDIKRVQDQVWKLATRVSNVSLLIPPYKLLTIYLKNHNLSAGAGDDAKFEIVPFTNGRDPTKDPVGF